jgi:hypothetical protein
MRRQLLALIPVLLALLWPTAARAQDAITELTVIYGGSSGIQCPTSFTKYGVDLNQGAGGDFIYLCYKRGIGAPVTGIGVSLSRDPVSQAPDGWTLVPVDLNRNAGGFYAYLYYTKYPGQADDPAREPDCRTVRDIVVVQSSAPAPAGYTTLEYDLNRGTDKRGDVLFFAYKEE